MNITQNNYRFAAVIEQDDDGFFAYCPELPGCHTQGSSHEEALANLKDAIQAVIEDMAECGEEIPQSHSTSLTTVDVAF